MSVRKRAGTEEPPTAHANPSGGITALDEALRVSGMTQSMANNESGSSGATIVDVVRRHQQDYISGSDKYIQHLAFPILIRRRGVTRSYSSPETYAPDAEAHRQAVIRDSGLAKLGFRTEAVVLLGPGVGCVRFHSLRLSNADVVLSAHAANYILTRSDNRWRISGILADDEPLHASVQIVDQQS